MDISEARTYLSRILILYITSLVFVLTLASMGPISFDDDDTGERGTPSIGSPTFKSLIPIPQNKPPIAVVTPSYAQVLVEERIVLSARESLDPDGTITEYRWFFGARGVVFGPEVTLKFIEPGLRTVILTVEDDDRLTSSTVASIEVLPQSSEPILILSAGPNNMLDLTAGKDGPVVMEMAAYNQPVSDVEVEILDDGGLDVSIGDFPGNLKPGEHIELQIRISAKDVGKDSTGSIIMLRAVSDQAVSDVERIEVMVQSAPTHASLSGEFVEFLVLIIGFSVVLLVIELWRKKR